MSTKKLACLILGQNYDTKKHQAAFQTVWGITYIFTVNNYEEAKAKVLSLIDEGFGVVELCGAFGEEKAGEILQLAQGRIAVGHVVYAGDQSEMLRRFLED